MNTKVIVDPETFFVCVVDFRNYVFNLNGMEVIIQKFLL